MFKKIAVTFICWLLIVSSCFAGGNVVISTSGFVPEEVMEIRRKAEEANRVFEVERQQMQYQQQIDNQVQIDYNSNRPVFGADAPPDSGISSGNPNDGVQFFSPSE